jgi:GR25 family glycosyltransferase involved in LPS biosynthesis
MWIKIKNSVVSRKSRAPIVLILASLSIIMTHLLIAQTYLHSRLLRDQIAAANSSNYSATLGFERIFVIYNTRRTDRYQYMVKLLEELGLKADMVQAHLPSSTRVMEYFRLPQMQNEEKKDEPRSWRTISCYFSHLSIYERMQRENINNALILEDDVDFEMDIHNLWAQYRKSSDSLLWDLLYIGYCYPAYLTKLNNEWSIPYSILCTNAYGVSLKFAKQFIGDNEYFGIKPIDYLLHDRCWANNCLRMMSNKILVGQLPKTESNPSELLDPSALTGQELENSASKFYNITL